MAFLITHHDPLHIHKILGVLTLLHFLLRLNYLAVEGTLFPDWEPIWQSSLGLVLHIALSSTSLLFPLPAKRNYTVPVIWHESRLHSILFASRSVIATLITLYNLWPKSILSCVALQLCVILGTTITAAKITEWCGDRELHLRTTRGFPYPPETTEEEKKSYKRFYTKAQFIATAIAIQPDASLNFAPLYGIQLAPFLLTLVRKGKIDAKAYHSLYTLSLLTSLTVVIARLLNTGVETRLKDPFNVMFALIIPQYWLRINCGWSQHVVWTFHVFCTTVLYPSALGSWHDSIPTKWVRPALLAAGIMIALRKENLASHSKLLNSALYLKKSQS